VCGAADRQVEPQVAIGDPIERGLAWPGGQRFVDRENVFLLDQPAQDGGERSRGDGAVPAAGLGRDVGVRAITVANRLEHPARGVRGGELGQQRRLGDPEQRGRRVRALALGELKRRNLSRPGAEDAGQSGREQEGVDRVRRVKAEGVADLGRIERAEQQVVGSAEERAVVGGQPLHHVQVAAQQQE